MIALSMLLSKSPSKQDTLNKFKKLCYEKMQTIWENWKDKMAD